MKAAYRFFDNDKVTFEKVIEPHVARTKERMAAQKVVLLVQDTTEIDLTRPEQEVEGAGRIGWTASGRSVARDAGLHDRGRCPWARCGPRCSIGPRASRMRRAAEKQRQRKQTPIEEKESLRWLTGLREARSLPRNCQRSNASAWPTARPTSTKSLPNREANPLCIG